AVIVATGGQSYPSTGSTGDGWAMAEATGHRTKPALPALTSIETEESWPFALSGLSLKNVTLSAFNAKNKRIYHEQGELLMTHFGISGPLALTLSSLLPEDPAGIRLTLNLKPALDEATLDRRLVRDLTEQSRKQLITVMDGLEPHALALAVLALAGISPALPANALTQEQRKTILRLLQAMPLTVKALRGLDEAIVTRGGVATADINPSTMESKRVPGLYFAGETIDIDALTGGFNLTLAFSTGALAGQSAAQT
ncbi:MAG: aminoacetone oxidase family FAD-binding enzyme, partial [Clostridia bacterium]|nr:aminoacetone oxidase family FAD-binding enzyme [Clostridia bacterium]